MNKLWVDGKNQEDIEAIMLGDTETVVYNLMEDIHCLNEDRSNLTDYVGRVRHTLAEILNRKTPDGGYLILTTDIETLEELVKEDPLQKSEIDYENI